MASRKDQPETQMAECVHRSGLADLSYQGEMFQAMAENLADAVVISDLAGLQVYGNRACYELFGYDYESQEMTGLPLADCWLQEDVSTLTETVLPQAVAGRWSGEVRQKRRDGALFDAHLTVFPVPDEAGQVVRVMVIVRDITERKRLQAWAEEALARRARQVQASTDVAQAIAAAPALDELYRRVVTLVKERFETYHAQIFRYDQSVHAMRVVEGYGEAGQRMKAAGYHLPYEQGVVGTAAAKGEPMLVTDLAQDPDWAPCPDLPATRSELAVPIKLQDQVWGVLDVQSDTAGALTEEDQIVLVGLAGQIAIAIENARLFEQAQHRAAQLEWLALIESALSQATNEEEILTAISMGIDLEQVPSRILLQYVETDAHEQPTTVYTVAVWHDGMILPNAPELYQRHAIEDLATAKLWLGTPSDPLFISDLQADSRADAAIRAHADQLDLRAVAFMPLHSGGRWQGLVTFRWSEEHAFSPDERFYLRQLIESASAVVAGRRAYLAQERARDERERRALQLQTASEVSRIVGTILDPNELIQTVVDLVRERFGLYYAGLFLVDQTGEWTGEAGRWAVLRAGTGEAGRRMLAEGHKLEVGGTSMIGWCVANKAARIALDVGEEAVRFDNPLLPQTRSEMALPLLAHGQAIGAMTVQSVEEAAFSDEDITVLQTMADQLATAIENARLFQEVQESLAEIEAVHRQYLREAWTEYVRHGDWTGPMAYAYDRSSVSPVQPIQLETEGPGDGPATGEAEGSALVAPITLRGETIGSFVFDDPERSRRWSAEEMALVEMVSTQVALALEGARLFEETQMGAGRQALINEMLHVASRSMNPEELLQQALRVVSLRLAIPSAVFLWQAAESPDLSGHGRGDESSPSAALRAGPTGVLVPVAMFGPGGDRVPVPEEARITRDLNSVLFEALDARETRALDAVTGRVYDPLAAADGGLGVHSAIYVPLTARDEILGAIELGRMQGQASFRSQDADFAGVIAANLSVALLNAHLYQAALRTAERLAEMDKLKSQFLANMSHELRTPLNSIIGFSRVILKGIDGPLTDMQRTDLEAIYDSGQHLLGLINNILDISKIQAGKMEVTIEDMDLNEVIQGVMSTTVALVKDKPVDLQQDIAPDLPKVRGDVRRIRQVLLNLVGNATKFTEEGFVRVEAYRSPEPSARGGEEVMIVVSDSGIGIPEENLGDIFEEFTQVDGSSTRRAGGSGLGLSISRHFVEMHEGRMWVESTLGRGSAFYVVLPVGGPSRPPGGEKVERSPEEQVPGEQPSQELAEELPGPSASSLDFARDRLRTGPEVDLNLVLCVDDDEGVITLFRRYLSKRGYRVVGLTDSTAVVEQTRKLRPFAITLDVMMPGKDGWEVIGELKADPETRHIPVIMCTIVTDWERGLSMGASDYLVKPILERDLLDALERLDGDEGPYRVLIIDDEPQDLELLSRILNDQGKYEVVTATGGLEAITCIQDARPDLIILDLLMPEVDGFAVLEAVKSDEATRSVPIIVVTAKDLTQEDRDRLNMRVEVLLQKGLFEQQELLEDVAAALERVGQRGTEQTGGQRTTSNDEVTD